jgi:hypothetical protein
MNKDFHYNITYLIAEFAGYDKKDALIIAASSQMVDDNVKSYYINKRTENEYYNYISQTSNILKPQMELFRIYPLFHFIPGDINKKNAERVDGKYSRINTTPNSKNARKIIKTSIDTGNLYSIGIACHSFVDTWAHQNFIGYYDSWNSMRGAFEKIIPDIGHADAKTNPDQLGLVWGDERLMNKPVRDNNFIFLDAAVHLFRLLYKGNKNSRKQKENVLIIKLKMLFAANENKRKILFDSLVNKQYNKNEWFDEAVKKKWFKKYVWKNINGYKNTNWFKFQEAIKWHQNMAWEVLNDSVFSKIDLKKL